MRLLLILTLSIFILLSSFYFANLSYQNTIKYNQTSKIIIDKLNVVDNLKLKLDTLLCEMQFKSFEQSKQAKLNRLNKESQTYLVKSKKYILFYFLSILLVGILLFLIEKNIFSLYISVIAIMSLAIAIFTPILLLIVKTPDMLVIGSLSLQHEVKTIIGIIGKLINIGNYILAFVLILVSLLIPFLKSFIILTHNILRLNGRDSELHQIIKTIGKWSMVDVLVVAILVVFFTTNEDVNSEMIIESGLYFFLIYVVLSMISTYEMLMVSENSDSRSSRSYEDLDWDEYE